MKTKIFILGLLLSAVSTFGQWNPTPFMRDYGNHRTNAIDARIGISALGTNDAVPLGFTGALTVTTNAGVVIAAIAITPATLNIRPGNGMTTLGDGTNVANNRLEIYDTATRNVLIQSAGISFLNGGNVGIATNNPQQALHVTGTIRATAFEDQNGNPISGGGGGGDVKTNANNTYTSNSTNNFAALTTFSNLVVVASNTLFYGSNFFNSKVTANNKFTANGTINWPGGAANVIVATDINHDLSPVFIGNGINWTNQILSFSGTNSDWTTPDDYLAVADSNGKLTNRTPVAIIFVQPGFNVGTVGNTNYVTNAFPATNYVFVSPGLTTTVVGTTVTVSNSTTGGAQTPWTTDIDGGGNALTNASRVTVMGFQPAFSLRSVATNDFSMDVKYTIRTNLFSPAAVAMVTPLGTNSSDTRSIRLAFDLVPKGSPTDRANVGVVWSDISNTNELGLINANFQTLRNGIFTDGTVYAGSAASGSGVVTNFYLEPYGGQVIMNGGFGVPTGYPITSKFLTVSTGSMFAGGYDNATPSFSANSAANGTFSFYDFVGGSGNQVMIGSNGIAIFPNGIQVPSQGSGTIANGINVGDLTVWNGSAWTPTAAGFYRVTGSTTSATATNLLTVKISNGSSVTIDGTFLLHGQTTNGHSLTLAHQVGLFRNDAGTVTSLGSNTLSHWPATGWSGTNWDGRYTISGTNVLIQGIGDTNGERVDFIWQGSVIGNAAISPNVQLPTIWLNSTNLPASGSISTWSDSSGNGHDFTNSANQPVFIAGPNSQRSAYFNGTSSMLWSKVATRSLLNNASSATIISVFAPNITNTTTHVMFFSTGTTTPNVARASMGEISTGGIAVYARRLDADSIVSALLSHVVISNYYILQGDYVPTVGPTLTGYTNGTSFATGTYAGTGNISATDSLGVDIGSAGNLSGFFNGNISEIMVFIPALTASDRAYWNAYLKTKFGL